MTHITPQQAREMAGLAMDHGTMAGVVESLANQVDLLAAICGQYERSYKQDERDMVKLTAERDDARQKFMASDLMAECTTMLRDDLIEAGIVSDTVPPMMLTEAIMRHVQKLTAERDALKADAERYRWLRFNYAVRKSLPFPTGSIECCFIAQQNDSWPDQSAFDDLDCAIDAAIKAAP